VTTSVDDVALAVDRLARCVSDVCDWMSLSRLRLNTSKTQAIWLGYKNQIDRIIIRSVPVLSSSVSVVDNVRDLGVVIDGRLTMSDHVTALCRSGYYQLRQLRPVTRALPEAAVKTLVQAFISGRLDYCNALLYGITDNLFRRLQSVQNAAARLLTGHKATRPHLTSSVTFALVASEATGRLQTDYIGGYIGLQVAARRNPFVPRG